MPVNLAFTSHDFGFQRNVNKQILFATRNFINWQFQNAGFSNEWEMKFIKLKSVSALKGPALTYK